MTLRTTSIFDCPSTENGKNRKDRIAKPNLSFRNEYVCINNNLLKFDYCQYRIVAAFRDDWW